MFYQISFVCMDFFTIFFSWTLSLLCYGQGGMYTEVHLPDPRLATSPALAGAGSSCQTKLELLQLPARGASPPRDASDTSRRGAIISALKWMDAFLLLASLTSGSYKEIRANYRSPLWVVIVRQIINCMFQLVKLKALSSVQPPKSKEKLAELKIYTPAVCVRNDINIF